LVDWAQTELEHVPYDDREWLMLDKSLRDAAQPARAAPAVNDAEVQK
jgi:hypothetical protein